jgi:hypothetical protein
VLTWRSAAGLVKAGKKDPELRWAADLGAMVQVSMIAYGSAGAFLSLAYYDLPYNVMVLAIVAQRLVRAKTRRPTPLPTLMPMRRPGLPPGPGPGKAPGVPNAKRR